MSMNAIERKMGIGKGVVSYHLNRLGVEIRSRKHYSQGEKNSSWKGGKITDKSGYVLVYAPSHPYKNHQNKVREHRLVMEKKIGRYLSPKEVVDHVDGDIKNNKINNLRLFANNAEHLRTTLTGKVPKWTKEGKKRILIAVKKKNQRLSEERAFQNLERVNELLHKSSHSKTDVQELQILKHRLRNKKARVWFSDKQLEVVLSL